ncbi:synaptic vesicle glycoprotein 2B isoform X2 [Diabrotica virgifera virgifera]|uniref:Major facilitator superfamily (MFS) profile domain-containing protein n=1 Tax=Diabrotica virgifera virgifera TaxID=50390 RepID=A0ABM5KJ39_DIAVI|nr:synaptic vesicle glycoprotein 2B isoform X2 [Diabrotica virgifera virgifera]
MDSGETKISLKDAEDEEKEQFKLLHKYEEVPKTFEEAISETGFGRFNYTLLVVILFPCATQMVETVGMTYIVPVAECDLHLTIEDKGLLNGVTFAGMISSGLFWGYLCDALGRKKIIVYGYLVTGFFSVMAAMSTSKGMLMGAKFMSGLILNGPYSATTTHITEFHSSKYRGTVHMIRGIFFSVINLFLPVLAWAILPRKINITIFGFEFHAWNVFMLICASMTIISGILYMFLPESPKYLMSMGRNRAALVVMRKVYSKNTGNPQEDFPVKKLVNEAKQNFTSSRVEMATALKSGWEEMKTILHRPHINNMILASFNAFSVVMSLNTLKFWLPGIFQSISDYQNNHNGTSSSMCVMLGEMSKPKNITSSQECSVDLDNFSVYLRTFIVASARVGVFVVAGTLVRLVGVKRLCIILTFISATCMFCIYFARSSLAVTILSAAGTAVGSVPENLLLTITLELFPTTLRTIALSIHLTAQRFGTTLGNVIFPYLVQMGCLPPFLFIGIFASATGLLSMLYANTENKPLI